MNSRRKYVLPLLVVLVGVVGGVTLWRTGPEVSALKPEKPVPVVRVLEVAPRTVQLSVTTHGTVAPRTESDLVPEVSGPVIWVSPSLVSGGFFEAGEELLHVDPRDYEVGLERAKASLARAESEYARAGKGLRRRRGLKKQDYASAAQLDDAVNAERVAAATVREARASLAQAERDLERTEIRAPYACRIREERVDVGQFVTRGVSIAKLYAIDYVEVRLPVPDDQLAYLDLHLGRRGTVTEDASPEVVLRARFAGAEHAWRGRVVRTEGEIDPKSRMVHAVARVEDPYGRVEDDDERPPLAVGLFVAAEILGQRVANVAVLPRSAMRSGNQVLVVDGEDRLRYRQVDVLRSGRDEVVVRAGLEAGERVCVSPLEAVVEGMKVRPIRFEESAETRT
jgi:RND family efflux transporter MFP subunit